MSPRQNECVLELFSVYKGMLGDVSIRLHLLQKQLCKTPEDVERVDREINHLEHEMDFILLSNETLSPLLVKTK